MKLTKKLEAEILKLYHKYWDAYLNGKMKTMSSMMDKNIQVIGSGKGEVFKNKKDAVKYYTDTVDQVSGKSEVRNKKINVMLAGSNILVTEESDYFVLMDKSWTFYGQARISTLFGKSNNKWKIIQQHGSLPDSRTGCGEQLNTDKIKEENLRLKDAIKRRTIELENKSRELEIEAALERVRAQAMGMNKQDDLLNICEILFKEFISLGFTELRNSMINIHNDDKKTFVNYDYSDKIGESINHLEYNIHPVIKKQIKKIRSADDAFSETVFKGADLKSWKAFRKKIGEKNDPRINKSTALYYYFYSIGTGSIGISTFSPIGKEKLQLLKRFRNVFKLSYQRYKDIEKAEAQAREATIETALERVRSLALGLRKSEDVGNVTDQFFTQLTELGVDVKGCSIVIIDEDNDKMELWRARSNIAVKPFDSTSFAESMDLLKKYMPDWFPTFIKALGKRKNYLIDELLGKRRTQFINLIAKQHKYSSVEKSKLLKNAPKKITAHYIFFKLGYLGLLAGKKLSDENLSIARRFVEVFDFAYTRFLDIKKAEAQAREAKIEAALEKVRAVAMSMQKAEGLLGVVEILNIELRTLGFTDIRNTIINIFNDTKENFINYDYSDYGVGGISEVDYNSHPANKKFVNKMREASTDFMITEFTGNELDEWKKWRSDQGQMPDSKLDQTESLYYYEYSIGVGSIGISTFSPISEDQLEVLKRFRNVFKLSYQRYVDITLAEAQAREAHIELALERVRASTMAMHKSEELSETAEVLFEQFNLLGKIPDRMSIGIINEESKKVELWVTDQGGNKLSREFFFSLDEPTSVVKIYNAWKEGKDNFVVDLTGQKLQDWLLFVKQNAKLPIDETKIIGRRVQQAAFFSQGFLLLTTHDPVADDIIHLLVRFAKVFDQTYTRFLDLKKVEAQAREAQIENALEKVRSRTMAMQKSEELSGTAKVFFEQMHALGELPDRIGINIIKEDEELFEIWTTNQDGSILDHRFRATVEEPTSYSKLYAAWKAKKDYIVIDLKGQELKKWIKFVREKIKMTVDDKNIKGRRIHNATFFSNGVLLCTTHEPVKDEVIKLLVRFAKVFDQTYRRFLDLQKAEAQARESQIEAALERVRSKTMAMHNSQDVGATVVTLFDEVLKLGLDKSIRVGIGILEGNEGMETWSATSTPKGKVDLKMGMLDMTIHPMLIGLKKAWESGKTGYSYNYIGDDVFRYYKALNNEPDYPFQADLDSLPENEYHKSFFYKEGILFSFAPNPISDEAAKVLNRFAGVFGQTYRRYLDLQKAEAQAREAQIETALERVRARTMAMHKSEELAETAAVLFQQMMELGVTPERITIGLIKEETKVFEVWSTDQEGIKINHHFNVSLDEPTSGKRIYEAWKEKKKSLIIDLSGQELNDWIHYVREVMGMTIKEERVREHRIHSVAFFSHGMILTTTPEPLPEESMNLQERFADVFNLTYRRFLDLKQAEGQVREAQIEASLERVRSKAMSMHSSEDLALTIDHFFHELKSLDVKPIRCGVGIKDGDSRTVDVTVTSATEKGEDIKLTGKLTLGGHPILDKVYEALQLQAEYFPVLRGEEISEYYQAMNPDIEFPNFTEDDVQYGYYFHYEEGGVFAWTEKELLEEEINVFRKFKSVLSLTYRRYIDLKEAEARSVEAVRQASLDRVRAEIASMRTSEDLNRITPIIWRELKNLEVPFFRCGVFIVDEKNEKVQVYLTTPDGKSLGVLNLPFDTNDLTNNTVEYWRTKKVYKEHWNKEEFISWTHSMMEIGQVQNEETYQGSANPPESLDLHFVPFSQGMLYVGDTTPLSDEKLQLVKTLAEAFSIAYARYEDFKHLEEAKARVEVTLSELKSAQAQLVHSEKMASLGELTAGIAHEIKNPLNFVNNFSEVSRELLDEMKVEIKNNNIEEVIDLVEDLKQNLDKINQHGKRADSIVKGMLLHSRGSTGEKSLTDINDLLDQYVNLAYHGMRATNKEFNITIEKDYDKSIEKINVVPQDISRVFLNIINNACYAAFDRKKNGENYFSPTLRVTTKKLNDRVEIKIGDNGNGIPADHLDKIFQPFFTTKPSGEGTGLGLSLSYDIVTKVHGGDLKVETKDSEGTKFFIQLPLL